MIVLETELTLGNGTLKAGTQPATSGVFSISRKHHKAGLKSNRPLRVCTLHPSRLPASLGSQFWPLFLPVLPSALLVACPSRSSLSIAVLLVTLSYTPRAARVPQLLGVGRGGTGFFAEVGPAQGQSQQRPHRPQGRRVQWPGVRLGPPSWPGSPVPSISPSALGLNHTPSSEPLRRGGT